MVVRVTNDEHAAVERYVADGGWRSISDMARDLLTRAAKQQPAQASEQPPIDRPAP